MAALLTLFDDDGFNPRRLFLSSTIGAVYAYDDFSYLNQKADGSVPVTALEQPVGLVVDQRWGNARGDDVKATGAVGLQGAATAATYNTSTGVGTVSRTDASNQSFVKFTVTAGRFYAVSLTNTGANNVLIRDISGSIPSTIWASIAPGGSFDGFVLATNGICLCANTGTSGFTVSSVRELPGLHAYQSTDAARPVLKGTPRYLNLDGTDDRAVTATGGGSTTGFLLVTGINVGGAGTARTIFSDRGTNTGYKVEVDAANNLVFTAGNGASFVSCTGPAITAGTSYVIACWHDGTNLNIKVGSGAVTSQAFATASAGTAAISIGRDNGAATGFYNGRLYPTVYIKDSTASVGAINATMAWVAGKGGIAL